MKILVVCKSGSKAEKLCTQLIVEGHEVEAMVNPDAIRTQDIGSDIDLAIVAPDPPESSVKEIVQVIKKAQPGLPVLVVPPR